jgi:hypothetical protein
MPTLPTDAEIRLNNVITCWTVSVNTLEILANGLQDPVLQAISNTTKSLLEHMRVNIPWSIPAVALKQDSRQPNKTRTVALNS